MLRKLFALMVLLAVSAGVQAGVTGITQTGFVLETVTVDRNGTAYVYNETDLIDVDLTAFNGASGVLLVSNGGSVPAPGSRATLIEDNRVDTGIINPDRGGDKMSFDLATPLVNSEGADLVVFEIDPSNESGDTLRAFINGIALNIASDGPVLGAVSADVYSGTTGDVDSLTELETTAFTKNSDPTQALFAYSIDLSDFGIALGASITSFQMGAALSGDTIDYVYVAGLPVGVVPEPASLSLLGLSSLMLIRRRRA